jgi:DNA (cytosine-5)-methyltransferase 1
MSKSSQTKNEDIKPHYKMVELFAGVGGFRAASENLDVEVVFWNQWEPGSKIQHAAKVYRARFGDEGYLPGISDQDLVEAKDHLPKNITKGNPGIHLLVGGFPCQDYSVAKSKGAALGLEGKKGVLWWPLLEVISKVKPEYIFLENVDRLLKSPSQQRGRDFAVMLTTLGPVLREIEKKHYRIEWRVIDASEYGGAQRRKRVFIVAKKIDGRKKKLGPESAKYFIERDGILAKSYPIKPVTNEVKTFRLGDDPEQISLTFGVEAKTSQFMNAGVYFRGDVYTTKVQAKEHPKKSLGSVLIPESEVEEEFYVKESELEAWEKLKEGGPKARVTKEGHEYTYSEGKMSLTDDLDKPARTIVTGEGGKTPSRFKHLIKVGNKYRRLTPIELEKLNGFKINHTEFDNEGNRVSNIRRAFFMGNALVVPVVRRAIKTITRELKDKDGD